MTTVILRRQIEKLPDLPTLPLLRRIYAARDITTAQQLEKRLNALCPPTALKGMTAALDVLTTALREQQRIVIVADYDADGATSCALAVRALRALGAENTSYVVPDRFKYGYGLTPEIVALAQEQQPQLLITVDNGISSIDGVEAARDLGIRVLITDHHLPGNQLPAADAIVNPNQPDDRFPSKHLAGVGVIFYVMAALRSHLREQGWFAERPPNMGQFLDLVAFGTVADVVILDHTNRILVEQGLQRIRARQCVPGITALIEVAGRNHQRLSASDIGYFLGPRLNAAGRLENMAHGIECLLCDDLDQARSMARELDRMNQERRFIEADMHSQAMGALEHLNLDGADLPYGLCLFDDSWHQGVIGILASRIKERTHRPVVAFAPGSVQPQQTPQLKGSARSVKGVHIRDVLDAVASQNPGLISKFGGHAMAAGLSLPTPHLELFSTAFDREVRRYLGPEDLRGMLLSDGELTPEELTLSMAETLRDAGPWGQGFPEPLFDGVFELVSHRVLQEKHLKLILRPLAGGPTLDAIAFGKAKEFGTPKSTKVHIAYRLDVNEYRGQQSVQLRIEHIEEA